MLTTLTTPPQVSNKLFIRHARRLGLERFVRAANFYGQGAKKAQRGVLETVPLQQKAVADMVEALVGAVYCMLGDAAAWEFVRRLGAHRS